MAHDRTFMNSRETKQLLAM